MGCRGTSVGRGTPAQGPSASTPPVWEQQSWILPSRQMRLSLCPKSGLYYPNRKTESGAAMPWSQVGLTVRPTVLEVPQSSGQGLRCRGIITQLAILLPEVFSPRWHPRVPRIRRISPYPFSPPCSPGSCCLAGVSSLTAGPSPTATTSGPHKRRRLAGFGLTAP